MEGIAAVTYRCNARCYMCNTWQFPTEVKKEIGVEVYEKFPKLSFVNVTGGEPFLRKDIEDIVDILRRKSKRVVISTNGFFTDKIVSLVERFPDVGVRISLEGLPKANDELRGIKDGFDHGLRTVLILKDMGCKDIGFGITVSDRNAKDLLELYRLAKWLKVEFASATIHNGYYFHKYDNRFEAPEMVVHEFERLISQLLKSRRIKDWFRAYFNYGIINYIRGGKRLLPCEMGADSFLVDPYGEVKACNVLDESMGNLTEDTFENIWNSERTAEVRKKARNCGYECWMVGSVACQMHKHIMTPIKWILKNKWSFKPGGCEESRIPELKETKTK